MTYGVKSFSHVNCTDYIYITMINGFIDILAVHLDFMNTILDILCPSVAALTEYDVSCFC